MEIYHGDIVYSKSAEELAEHRGWYLAVEDGVVEGLYPTLPERLAGAPVTELGEDVLIPAFSESVFCESFLSLRSFFRFTAISMPSSFGVFIIFMLIF